MHLPEFLIYFTPWFGNDKNIPIFAPQFSKRRKLNYLKQFNIPFKGLALGEHVYEWELSEPFFEAYSESDILDGKLNVRLNLEKQYRMLVLHFGINGSVVVACDRCLDDLDMAVQVDEPYFIKFGQERKEESEEVLVIPESEYQINIADLLHDFIVLSLPMKRVHGEDANGISLCDKKTIQRLESLKHENKMDPRWEALKNIKLDNNI